MVGWFNTVDCGLPNRLETLPGGASGGAVAVVLRSSGSLVVLVNILNLPNRFFSTPVVVTLPEVVIDAFDDVVEEVLVFVLLVVAPVLGTALVVVA